jgi:hypothetical protein
MMKVGGIHAGLEPYPAKCYGPNLCVETHKLFKKSFDGKFSFCHALLRCFEIFPERKIKFLKRHKVSIGLKHTTISGIFLIKKIRILIICVNITLMLSDIRLVELSDTNEVTYFTT